MLHSEYTCIAFNIDLLIVYLDLQEYHGKYLEQIGVLEVKGVPLGVYGHEYGLRLPVFLGKVGVETEERMSLQAGFVRTSSEINARWSWTNEPISGNVTM